MDIGIDLGTTFSVLAVDGKVDLMPDYPGGDGYYLKDCNVTIIPSPVGEYTFPSVMIPDPDYPNQWLFGAEAAQKADEGLAPVMFSKRKIGTTELIPTSTGMVTAREVAAHFLAYLKQCAEVALGRKITRAVITHPAYFDPGAVEETREAARDAGFDMSLPKQMLMEPVAAALCYARTDTRDPLRILTYDLGGGTFDVTYMERRGGVNSVKAFDGNHLLGGYNFDLALVHLVLARLAQSGRIVTLDEDNPEDRGRLARLLRLAEDVKIKLSKVPSDESAVEFRAQNILTDNQGHAVQISERITRKGFVAAIQDHLNDILVCCHGALKKGDVRPENLHEILLVGGSTAGPWVVDGLKAAFPQATPRLFEPDLCVGAGAAIHARMVLSRVVDDELDAAADYVVTLETPEATLLEHIDVAGRIVQRSDGDGDGQGFMDGLTVTLCQSIGIKPTPIALATDGRFLFRNIELTEQVVNTFVLHFKNADNKVVHETSFSVLHGAADGISETPIVLPRPLYIETAYGMVALAEEGVPLPAKCVANFERSNSNSSMELRLFQEHDPVGVVRIQNIPKEAGVGSPVVLTLKITTNNQVLGDVTIYQLIMDQNGVNEDKREVLRDQVKVSFDPTVIPSRDELDDQFEDAKEHLERICQQDPDFAEDIEADATELVRRTERNLSQQIVERQEVHVALRKLRDMLEPPKDGMSPTRLEFKRDLRKCRGLLHELRSLAHGMAMAADDVDGDDMAKEKSKGERALKRLAELEIKLRSIEEEGLAAHQETDRAAWQNKHALLLKTETQLNDIKKVLRPAIIDISWIEELLNNPAILKIMVCMHQIQPLKEKLAQKAGDIERKGALEIWSGELDDINEKLDLAAHAVNMIDDELDKERLRAKIQIILQSLPGLDARIGRIGKDLLH